MFGVYVFTHVLRFPDNTIIAWIKDNYHEQGNIIIILLLLPLGHISNIGLAGCKWAIREHAVNRLYMGRPATFWPSQMGRPFHRNGPLLGRATCRHIIGAFRPMSGWHLSQRWADTCFLQPMMILHVENPHWSGLLTGYLIQNRTR